MANEIKLPEETLMRLGFRLLDITYGELTIKKSSYWDELFVDKDNNGRLGYDKPKLEKGGYLGYYYKDRDFFLSILPVGSVGYLRVLKAWALERYKRKVDTTDGLNHRFFIVMLERYNREVDTTI